MPQARRLTQYPAELYEIVSKVERGGSLTIDFDSPSEARDIRKEFYNFRTALRDLLAQADKISVQQDGKKLRFKRKLSVYAARLQKGGLDGERE